MASQLKFCLRQKLQATAILTLCLGLIPAIHAGGPPPAVVKVENAMTMDIAPFVWVTGTVISRYDSRIAAEVEGRLESVLDVGEIVNQGDVIATIDDKTYRLAVDEIQTEIKPISTMVEFYRKEAERLTKLAKQNNAARNQLDQTEANRDEAQARIRMIRARLATANDNLDRTLIRAPFTGIITERIKSKGERVEQGDEVIRLVDTEMLEIQAYIQRNAFVHLKTGDRLAVKGPSANIEAEVRTVIPVGDVQSRLYEIRLTLKKRDWPAGTAVKVASPTEPKQSVLVVPRDALVIRQSGTAVYKVNGDSVAKLVPVKTGIANTTHIQVIGDIQVEDKIVTRGNERLRPGQKVRISGGSSS